MFTRVTWRTIVDRPTLKRLATQFLETPLSSIPKGLALSSLFSLGIFKYQHFRILLWPLVCESMTEYMFLNMTDFTTWD